MNKIFNEIFVYKNNNGDKFICLIIIIIIIQEIYNEHQPNITLKIKGGGYRNIFGHEYLFNKTNYQYLIKINESKRYIIKNNYEFDNPNNIVDLFWYNDSIDCAYMFSSCPDIYEISFSYFNSRSVKNMSHMFNNCSSLSSLNLSVFNTSQVTDMSYMFNNCSSLT